MPETACPSHAACQPGSRRQQGPGRPHRCDQALPPPPNTRSSGAGDGGWWVALCRGAACRMPHLKAHEERLALHVRKRQVDISPVPRLRVAVQHHPLRRAAGTAGAADTRKKLQGTRAACVGSCRGCHGGRAGGGRRHRRKQEEPAAGRGGATLSGTPRGAAVFVRGEAATAHDGEAAQWRAGAAAWVHSCKAARFSCGAPAAAR